MKILERERLNKDEAKEGVLYAFYKCRNAWLGYFENGCFWACRHPYLGTKFKLKPEDIHLLFETAFKNEQIELAYIRHNNDWFKSFLKSLVDKRVKYTAVLINDESSLLQYNKFKHLVPDDWTFINHHMTLCLGEKEKHKELLGSETKLKAVAYSIDTKKGVMAVKVESELESDSVYKHITLALSENAQAVMSNELTDFVEIEPYELTGHVSYVLNNKTESTSI